MSQASLSQKLLDAKVPQLLGTYLAVGFGLLQFVEFIVNRYAFDSGWVDRYLLLWLGLIPAVALLLYYRGLPKKPIATGAGWKKGAIFANLGIIGVLLLLVQPATAGPATETVAFVDEDGVKEERTIPSRTAVQRVAVFDFQRKGEEEEWWGTAYSLLLNEHLRQRPELINANPVELAAYYDRFGAEPFEDINIGTQRKIAQRARTDYFVSADYEVSPQGHSVKGALHRTRDGKAVQSLEASAEDIYTVVDRLKEQIDDYLPPLGDLDKVESELPSSSLITDKVAALEPYVKGTIHFTKSPSDLGPAITLMEEAIEVDPASAVATFSLGSLHYIKGEVDRARELFRIAVRQAEVLPEREQFLYKTMLVSIDNDTESTIKILEAFKTLYPYDWFPYQMLDRFYGITYGADSAIVLMEQAAELSNRELALERLYALYGQVENYEEVERVIDRLDADFPDKDKSLIRRASLYKNTGRTEEARAVLEEMMALDPLNPDPPNQLIRLEISLGNYDKAEGMAQRLLRQATTATDSTSLLNRLIMLKSNQGQIASAQEALQDYEAFLGRRVPRLNILMQNLNLKIRYGLLTNDDAYIQEALGEIGVYDGTRGEMFQCLMPFNYSIYGIKKPGLKEQFEACKPTLATMGPMMSNLNRMTELLLAEDYQGAADFIDARKAENVDVGDPVMYARINRLAGRLDRAKEILVSELVSNPGDPLYNLQLAMIEKDQGNEEAAGKALAVSLKAFKNADANFRPANEAKQLAAELGIDAAS